MLKKFKKVLTKYVKEGYNGYNGILYINVANHDNAVSSPKRKGGARNLILAHSDKILFALEFAKANFTDYYLCRHVRRNGD